MMDGLVFSALKRGVDDAAVLDLMRRAEDYVVLEDGRPADAAKVTAYFTDCVPGGDSSQAMKIGVEREGRLVGVADMGFGYPAAGDAYIGLLLLDPAMRGHGLGKVVLGQLVLEARGQGARRLLVAVLRANPRGQAFWAREGFVPDVWFGPAADDPLAHERLRMTRDLGR